MKKLFYVLETVVPLLAAGCRRNPDGSAGDDNTVRIEL